MSIISKWKDRLRFREGLLRSARKRHEAHPTAASRDLIDKRKKQVAQAKAAVEAADGWRPKIVNLNFRPNGPLAAQPKIQWVTGHYTAGPVDRNDTECEKLLRGIDSYHKLSNGWTMIGYAFAISRKGTLYLCRPATMVGAHTLNHNTANVGVVCNGTTGDRPTAAQAKTFRWLLQNAHTSALPPAFQVNLRGLPVKGHNDWMSTSCPGAFKTMYVSKGAQR